MSEFDVFLLGCINFAALIALLVWGMRRVARQFFYARRANLQKQMVSVARSLRAAKGRAARSRLLRDRLAVDIAHRKDGVAASAAQACDLIAKEAGRRARRIVETADRQRKEQQACTIAEVRRQMVVRAFAQARALVEEALDRGARRRIIDRGCGELSSLLSEGRESNLWIKSV